MAFADRWFNLRIPHSFGFVLHSHGRCQNHSFISLSPPPPAFLPTQIQSDNALPPFSPVSIENKSRKSVENLSFPSEGSSVLGSALSHDNSWLEQPRVNFIKVLFFESNHTGTCQKKSSRCHATKRARDLEPAREKVF